MVRASDFVNLPTDEKLQLVTELWDQIAAHRDTPVLPDWVHAEAGRRFEKMDLDPGSCLSEDEMWRQIDDAR